MSLEQLATGPEQIATKPLTGTAISESPQMHRSSYQSQCNEVIDLPDRAAGGILRGWIAAPSDCLGRARRVLAEAMSQEASR